MKRARSGPQTVRRAFQMISRYGWGHSNMLKNVTHFMDAANKLTLAVTANVLGKYPFLIRQKIGYAVHGLYHSDYSRMNPEKQKGHLTKALEIFGRFGLKGIGFRAPYLKANEYTLQIIKELGFLYDSSCPIHWDILPASRMNRLYGRVLDYYQPQDSQCVSSLPFYEDGFLRIPVSLPDDEMLIDRLRIRDQGELFRLWNEILIQCHSRKEMFVLQLHPERFHLADRAVIRLMDEAERLGMWIATLQEVAAWWITHGQKRRWPENKHGAFCATGDIDRITLCDAFTR